MPPEHATNPPATPSTPAVWWAAIPARSALLVEGGDAVRFLDNFTTASLAPLAVGGGTEGFFADGRGHVLAVATLLRTPAGIWIDAAPGLAGRLHEHLEHYHIREAVSFRDASAERAAFLLHGDDAAAWLGGEAGVALASDAITHRTAAIDGIPAELVTTDWYGAGGCLVITAAADADRMAAWLAATGLPRRSTAEVDAARIDAGSPEPHDIPPKTLPQELGRDTRAICFTKGCYLGQETVARLDALGHVNRRLVGIATDTAVPPAVHAQVMLDAGEVGMITSACLSPTLGAGLGLAIVHVRALAAGAVPTLAGAPVRLMPLPASPAATEPRA
jgi:folate-binding protein YgfZ